jgi:hypothetical protein
VCDSTNVTALKYIVHDLPDLGDNKHGYIVRAVLKVLEDGRARNADEILEAGQSAGLFPKTLTRKALYIHIVSFIKRQAAAGRPAAIVQDPKDRFFHIAHPPDTWPEVHSSFVPLSASDLSMLATKLHETARGEDPTAFELAACEAFEALGFLVQHIGGYDAPDALLTAPLGAVAYTAILECEASQSGLIRRVGGVVEAAKHRESYRAHHAILLGPSFQRLGTLDEELQTHDVGLWTVDDVIEAISSEQTIYDLQVLFAAGRAANKLQQLAWNREHGAARRVRIIGGVLIEQGWKAQVLFAQQAGLDQAPLLTEDSAMMLVDSWLQQNGATTGCAREDVRAAFAYLTNPLVGRAVGVSGRDDAIILTSARGL